MVYKTGNNLENYPLINAVCLIVLHQFFFCHGDFPVSRNGQSDGNIKVGLRIADAGRVYDSLRSGLVINQPLKNRVLHELGIHQRSKIIFGEHFIHHLLPAARDAQGDTVIHKFLPLLVFHYRQRFIRAGALQKTDTLFPYT